MNRENIILFLVNRECNPELLQGIPNRDFENLSIIYYEYLEENNDVSLVTNTEMTEMELTENELYDLAYENTKRIFPLKVTSMPSVIRELGFDEYVEPENATPMYVLGNEKGVLGASAILYPEVLKKVEEALGGNYMLLPSSQHEFIALAKDETMDLNNLQSMVQEINFTTVEPRDRLSDHVYEYDSASGQVKQVTFGPETSLYYGSLSLKIETDEDMEEVDEVPEQNPA